MYIHSGVCAILIAALYVFNCCLCLDTSCDLERIRVPGNIVISAIVGLREPINKECGKYGASEIMVASAMVWAVTKLNGSPGHPSFIPNKTIGIEMSDDCFLERKAVQIGLDMLRAVKSPDVATCAKSACHNETSQFVGLIDTSTSQTTGRVAELFRGTNMPVIATAATAADLGNRTRYPTFFRLVPSDVKQMKVLLETLKALSWTYVAVVYTTDAYGIEGLEMLRKFASTDEKVCIMAELAISPQETRTVVARNILGLLATRLARTRHGQLGVIYIGQLSQAELLIRIQHLGASASLSFRDFQQIYWVMSEAVGTNNGLIQPSQVGGLLTVALSSPELSEFKTYFIDEVLKSVTSPTTTMGKLYTKYVESFFECEMGARGEKQCPILTRELLESRYKQADYVASAVDAVYVLASAVKQEYCIDGLQCSETSTKPPYTWPLQQRIQDSILHYTQFEAHLVPQEFQIPQRIIRFDNFGEIISVSSTPSYDIYNVWDKVHTKVGYYQDDKLTIHTDSINMKHPSGIKVSGSSLPKSSCRGGCPECVSEEGIPFHYIPGERIIVGLFSLSSKVNEDFKCGPFRSHTVSYLTFEAFNYAISAVREQHPHLNFGGLAFDDCYSPLRAEYILSSFLSGNYKLVDSNTNTPIDPNKVVLVVGPLSSDVSLEVADMLTRLKIPQISYGATSTDLNDRQKYPYFLRTVPSDESQAKVIVSILEEMNWKYVAAIHIDNNYGVRGMETFKEMANKKGICVTGAIPLKDTVVLEDFEGVVSKLRKTYTTVVIFFGIDTLAEKVLDGLYQYANDEEFVFVATEAWGRNEKLLGEGRERVAKGSIILHSDTAAPALYKRFSDYMRTKNPFTCTKCRWLKEFWQDHFRCDLEDGYMGIGRERTLCNQNDHGVYATKQDEQRVIHTIYAVQAAAKGIEAVVQSLCQGKVCTSSLRQMPRGAEMLVRRISEVSLSPSPNSGSLFDKKGNGNVGFEILNIQYIPSLTKYEYKSVGHYSRSTLVLEKQKIVFYDQYQQPRPFDYIKTKCEKGLGQCDECEQQTSTPAPSDTTTAASTPRQSTGQSYKNQFIAMTILAVLAIIVIAVVFFCYCFRRRSTKSTKRDPQQEEGSTNRSFQNTSTSDITLGQISASIHDDPLYCEVNSINSSRAIMPGSCSGSRQASVGVCSAGGSGTGSSGSSGLTQLKLLKQKCLCPAPQMFGYVDTASGRLVICGHCQGVVNSTVVLPVDMSNV